MIRISECQGTDVSSTGIQTMCEIIPAYSGHERTLRSCRFTQRHRSSGSVRVLLLIVSDDDTVCSRSSGKSDFETKLANASVDEGDLARHRRWEIGCFTA